MPPAPGTVNISFNARKAERDILGRRAFEEDRSLGNYLRRLIMKGAEIEDPELARRLKEARNQRFAVNAVVVLVGLTTVFQATFGHSKVEIRKPRVARQSIQQLVRREVVV